MTVPIRATAGLLVIALVLAPAVGQAEGSGHPNTTSPDKPVAVARKKAAKPKPAVAPPSLPDKPIPYSALSAPPPVEPAAVSDHAPAPVQAEPAQPEPGHPVATAAPEAVALPVQPVTAPAPPLPAPVTVEAVPAPVPVAPPAPSEISLKCDTRTTRDKAVVSSGTFYIDIFPSPVYPDAWASFQFRFVDPSHDSLIRGSLCLDTICSAQVSGSAYALVSRVTKKGNALRVSLDRSQGAFYAEEIHGKKHFGEQGYCTVQPLPSAKF